MKIHDPCPPKDKPEIKRSIPLNLALMPGYMGGVKLVCVDSNGKEIAAGRLLSITRDGKIRRASSVNPLIEELKLGECGKVIIN